MPPQDPDDSFVELADEEAKRSEHRGFSDPRLRYILLLVIVIVVVLGAGILIRNWMHSGTVSGYKTYIQKVTAIVDASDKVGSDLSALLVKPGNATRTQVQSKLDSFIQISTGLSTDAKKLAAPKDLKEAQQWFAATMQLREKGLTNLKPALLDALDVQDLEVSSDRVSRALMTLMLSDMAYQDFFADAASGVLSANKITGVVPPQTSFLPDSTLATQSKVKEILNAMKSSDTLQAVHGVELVKVVAKPANKEIKADGTYNLASSDKLEFVVTVTNSGNMTEKDVPVTLKLTAPSSKTPETHTDKIAELAPKQQKEIIITGVTPTPYGEKSLLEVSAGPVPNEKITGNNKVSAYVIFTL
jgi:hypothetical protein